MLFKSCHKTFSIPFIILSLTLNTLYSAPPLPANPPNQGLALQLDPVDSKNIIEVVEGQLKVVREGNIPKAYALFTSLEFKKITSIEQFQQFVSQFPVFLHNKSITLRSVNIENGIAFYRGSIFSADGQMLDVEYELTKEQGVWKILGIQLYRPASNPNSLMPPPTLEIRRG